jgi:hypothetical protein
MMISNYAVRSSRLGALIYSGREEEDAAGPGPGPGPGVLESGDLDWNGWMHARTHARLVTKRR